MTFLLIVFVLIIAAYLYARSLSSKGYKGPATDHYDGKHFFTPGARDSLRLARPEKPSTLKWLLEYWRRGGWEWRNDVVQAQPPERVQGSKVRVTYINHATVLIQTAGLNIITDPVWSYRVSPLPWIGPKRYRKPGIALADLPPIDLILLSHNHYDHMDLATLRKIARRFSPRIFTALGNAAYLLRKGISGAVDMDWWQEKKIGDIKVVAVPAQHFSARTFSDRNVTLWCGFMLETPAGNIYFAGDTGYGPFFKSIAERYKNNIRLAFIPIGAYLPQWMMQPVHMSPNEALQTHQELGIKTSIGIHFGTFRMADDVMDEPPQGIHQQRTTEDFRILNNGQELDLG